jgi:hypothetical protein
MDANKTKEAFAGICERFWGGLQNNGKMDDDLLKQTHLLIAKMVMTGWNACYSSRNKAEAKKLVRTIGGHHLTGEKEMLDIISEVIDIKWTLFRDDDTLIEDVAVTYDDGQPKAIAYLEGEPREPDTSPDAFQRYINSPEIRERLASVPPDKFNEEMAKIVDEFNSKGKR